MADAVLEALERDEAYAVVRVLSDKASGRTELVSDPATGTFYVRKRIPRAIANPQAWAQLAQISDPRLPRVVETYALPDAFVTVCDYVEGFSVGQLVDSSGALDAERTAAILDRVCGAAGTLHSYGIIHRDITPANVIVAADGAHLIDLGIARVGDATARHDTTHLGTWGFAAPEQFGFAQTDARSDVYSIGSLAAFMLTGIRPDDDGFDDAIDALPADIRAVIEKARAFEPSDRHQTASELQEAFRAAFGGMLAVGPISFIRTRFVRFADTVRAASTPRKLLALLLIYPFYVLATVGIDAVIQRWPALDTAMRIRTVLFALSYQAAFVAIYIQCAYALLGAGRYAVEQHKIARLLINIILIFAAMIAVMVVVSMAFL